MTYIEIAIVVKWAQFAASVAMIIVSVVFCVASLRLMKTLKAQPPKVEAWTPLIKNNNGSAYSWINAPTAVGLYDVMYGKGGYAMLAFWDGSKFLSPLRKLISEQPSYWRTASHEVT